MGDALQERISSRAFEEHEEDYECPLCVNYRSSRQVIFQRLPVGCFLFLLTSVGASHPVADIFVFAGHRKNRYGGACPWQMKRVY